MPKSLQRFLPLLVALAALACARPALAQLSGIRGKVTGPDGKPMAGVTVVFKRQDIEGSWKVKTNKKGEYGHYGLPLGMYSVQVLDPTGKVLFTMNKVQTQPGVPIRVDINLHQLQQQRMQGLTPQQLAAYKKAQAQRLKAIAENAKINQLNQLLKQNQTLAKAGQWTQAIAIMQQAANMDQGKHALIYANLGDDYTGAKQWALAAQAYQKAIAIQPGGAYYINLGNAEAHAGQTQQAMAAFAKGIQMDPSQTKVAYLNEAVVFYNSGQYGAALTAAEKALAVDPNNAKAWYIKGMALMNKMTVNPKTNMPVPAPGTRTAFKKVMQLAPGSAFAQQAKANLQLLSTKVQTNDSSH